MIEKISLCHGCAGDVQCREKINEIIEVINKTKDLCECGNNMHTEHDDRKFELDNKEVCVECWTKTKE